MNVNYINSFILGIEDILSQMAPNIELERKDVITKKEPFVADSVISIVGFNGDINGQVVFVYKENFALHLASTICGMEIQEIDELALSALGEISNMASGRAVIKLDELAQKKANITPPTTLHSGDQINISVKQPIISIPFDNGSKQSLEINFSLTG
ncbi:MAG: chemotaxis protein CheX [Firmicutes bacterium]|nr:chemotaxis protein CheX [Bacillota bacterium]